jgi:NhaP-type Na+/H+ or K+/H+ antiporter
MCIGAILPWSEFDSEITGITPGRLIALGVLVLLLRRIPAMMVMYKAMPNTVKTWRKRCLWGILG